jgi:hypothetical protein
VRTPGQGARRAVAGLALGAAGMLYSRLGGRREQPAAGEPEPERKPAPEPEPPPEPEPREQPPEESPAEVERARSELADELARRATRSNS